MKSPLPNRLVKASFAVLSLGALGVAMWQIAPQVLEGSQPPRQNTFVSVARRVPVRDARSRQIVASAKAQIGTRYDAAFQMISYPMGDVAANRGACTDVIVRSLRAAKVDLQKLIHEDMRARFAQYPQKWGEKAPNASIDHRRVPNQIEFLKRHAQVLGTRADSSTWTQWKPGDIVYWNSGRGRLHTGIISDGVAASGEPFVIHNGSVCMEDSALNRWPIIGHFRLH
jgi:uncharacterized protein YijF (DUF1287 family)